MSFFYDLNKRLANLAKQQQQEQIAESKKAKLVAQSPLTKALNESMTAEAGYSAKAGRAGKDLGKPGKNFAKIAKGAAERYGSKEAGERVAGAVLKKIRAKEDMTDEGNAFTGALAKTPKGGKFKVGNKEFTDTSSLEEADNPGLEEGYAEMDAWLKSREAEKGTGRFDKRKVSTGTVYTRKPETFDEPEDDEDNTPKKKGRRAVGAGKGKKLGAKVKGTSKLHKLGAIAEDGEYDAEGEMAKGQIHTIVRHAKELESILHDHENLPEWVQEKLGQIKGMMTTVADYMISNREQGIEDHTGREGVTLDVDMEEGWRGGGLGEPDLVKTRIKPGEDPKVEAWQGLHAIIERGFGIEPNTLKTLKKIAKVLKPEGVPTFEGELDEKAPPGAKAERMVKHIKKSLSKDGKLSDKDKAIAYATTWKAHNAGKVEEESKPDYIDLDKDGDKKESMKKAAQDREDQKAERAGKKVTKDIEYDEGHKGKDDDKAERAGKKVTKDIEYDDKKDKKEKKVDETTTSGSVATAPAAPKSSKGMAFGKGVYESLDKQFKQALTESITVQETVEECGMEGSAPGITIQASGEDAMKLMQLLKLAGLTGGDACPGCGHSPCDCQEELDENNPDWPTNTETLDAEPNLRTYSSGLNGPKSTGQTTVPVIASQARRQGMEESVRLEKTLSDLYKNYKG